MLSLSSLYHNWLVVIVLVCLCNAQRDQNGIENDDVEEGHGDGEGDFWGTFKSVAGRVASSAGAAASSGADSISSMFTSEDNKDNKVCEDDECVEEEDTTTSLEKTGGILTTVGNAWSNTAGAALDGVKNTVSGQVDAILGALGTRLATALTPEYLITKGLSFLPSQLVSTIVFIASLILAYIIASFISIFTAISFLMAVYLLHAVFGPLWIVSMMLMGLDYVFWTMKCLVFYPRLSAVIIFAIFASSIYWFYISPFVENRRRQRKMDDIDDNMTKLMGTVDRIQRKQAMMEEKQIDIYNMVKELHDRDID